MVDVGRHPNIELMTLTELIEASGYLGNFEVKLRKHPRYVTEDCTFCGDGVVNGDLDSRLPHLSNISFPYVEGESLIMGIKDVAVSSGSACTSASPPLRRPVGVRTASTIYASATVVLLCLG